MLKGLFGGWQSASPGPTGPPRAGVVYGFTPTLPSTQVNPEASISLTEVAVAYRIHGFAVKLLVYWNEFGTSATVRRFVLVRGEWLELRRVEVSDILSAAEATAHELARGEFELAPTVVQVTPSLGASRVPDASTFDPRLAATMPSKAAAQPLTEPFVSYPHAKPSAPVQVAQPLAAQPATTLGKVVVTEPVAAQSASGPRKATEDDAQFGTYTEEPKQANTLRKGILTFAGVKFHPDVKRGGTYRCFTVELKGDDQQTHRFLGAALVDQLKQADAKCGDQIMIESLGKVAVDGKTDSDGIPRKMNTYRITKL